ncbi:MAG: penicillin acylase family protein [Burkholderiaceae bacterium]
MNTASRKLPGLQAPVDLWRDAWGIPHLRARGADDAFFAMGYVHAADRLWQMDAMRRRSTGRYAEWIGAAALPMDTLVRRMDLAACSRRDAEAAGPEARAMLAAYTAGINAAIATEPLPVEYTRLGETPEPWEDWHCVAVLRHTSLLLNSVYPKIWRAIALPVVGAEGIARLRMDDGEQGLVCQPPGALTGRLMPELAELAPAIAALMHDGAPDSAGGGSNNWTLHGSRTVSGRPLLAGDPHRLLDMPNMYLQCHVACDEFDVIGLTSPGVPGFPHFAHNAHVAWGVTVAFVDTADVYLERFENAGRRYLLRTDDDDRHAEWADTVHRVERIGVRGQAEPIACEVFVTARGPVVAGDPAGGSALVLRHAPDVEVDRSFDCLRPMLRATSVDQLFDACASFGLVDHNLVAADTAGHIGHLVRARVPRRPAVNGWLPVPGWLERHAWQGWIAPADMPRQVDPAGGLIVTANNRVRAPQGDYLCTDCHPPHRAQRIRDRLNALRGATVADMQAVHRDMLSLPAGIVQRRLRGLTLEDGPAAALRDRLLAWDGRINADSIEAALYASLRMAIAKEVARRSGLGRIDVARQRTVAPGLGIDYQIGWCVPHLLRADDRTLLGGADWDEVLGAALRTVAMPGTNAHADAEAGADAPPVRWGDIHRLRLRHPLAAVFADDPVFAVRDMGPVGGDNDTVWTTGYVPQLGTHPTYASLARYVFDVGDWDACRWIVFHGTAGDPRDPHYDDQSALWRRGETVPMRYRWETIAAEAERHVRLEPR